MHWQVRWPGSQGPDARLGHAQQVWTQHSCGRGQPGQWARPDGLRNERHEPMWWQRDPVASEPLGRGQCPLGGEARSLLSPWAGCPGAVSTAGLRGSGGEGSPGGACRAGSVGRQVRLEGHAAPLTLPPRRPDTRQKSVPARPTSLGSGAWFHPRPPQGSCQASAWTPDDWVCPEPAAACRAPSRPAQCTKGAGCPAGWGQEGEGRSLSPGVTLLQPAEKQAVPTPWPPTPWATPPWGSASRRTLHPSTLFLGENHPLPSPVMAPLQGGGGEGWQEWPLPLGHLDADRHPPGPAQGRTRAAAAGGSAWGEDEMGLGS